MNLRERARARASAHARNNNAAIEYNNNSGTRMEQLKWYYYT